MSLADAVLVLPGFVDGDEGGLVEEEDLVAPTAVHELSDSGGRPVSEKAGEFAEEAEAPRDIDDAAGTRTGETCLLDVLGTLFREDLRTGRSFGEGWRAEA